MSWEVSMILTLLAPFAFGLAVMGLLKLCAMYASYRKRRARMAKFSMLPFRGVRISYDDQH